MGGGGGSQVLGYKYFLGMHMVVCQGPVDAIVQVIAGEKAVPGSYAASNRRLLLNAPDLFGGEKKEGGIVGYVDFMLGGDTQVQNDYLASKINSNVPSFRGVVSLVLRKVYVCAMNPYPKPWWVKIKRIPGRSWYSEKADMSGSANPAHIIYEVATSKTYGLGYTDAQIDQVAFRAAADTLYAENFRMSLLLSGEGTAEEFIQIVLDHINGTFYLNQKTGLFTLKLLRDDYNIGDLPVYNEYNIISLDSFQRALPSEIVNEVVISYRPMGTAKDSSVTYQDLASIQAQGGVISQKLSFPGLDTAALAAKVGMRELRLRSSPLASIKITVNRKGWSLNPGDPFVFSWDAYGITQMVFRVVRINYGDLTDGKISIDAVEDVFGLPDAVYSEPPETEWTDPISDPVPVVNQRIFELPYFALVTSMTAADFQAEYTDLSAWIQTLAEAPVVSPGYILETKPYGGEYLSTGYEGGWTPECTLTSSVGKTETVFSVSSFDDSSVKIGGWAVIEDEIVRIDSIDMDNYRVTVGRGCLDTVPAGHASGARLWFADGNGGYDPIEYSSGELIYAKILTRTGKGVLSIDSALEMSMTLLARAGKPYPPGQFKVNGSYYPSNIIGALVASWVERNRLTQTASVLDVTAGNVPAESGATQTVMFYGQDGTLLRTVTGLTGPVYSRTWTEEQVDSNLREFRPPLIESVGCPMDSGAYIRGDKRDPLVNTGQNLTNVTFDGIIATFTGGYFDIGSIAPTSGKPFSVVIRANDPSGGSTERTFLSAVSSDFSVVKMALAFYGGGYRVRVNNVLSTVGSSHTAGKEIGVLVTVEPDQPSTGQTRVTVYESGVQTAQMTFASVIDFSDTVWSVGSSRTNTGARTNTLTGKLRGLRLYDNRLLTPSDVWPNNLLNNIVSVSIKSNRSGVDSLQTATHTCDRRGWSYQFDKYFNGQ